MPTWTTVYVILYWFVALPCVLGASLRWGDRALRYASGSYAALVIAGRLSLHHTIYSVFEAKEAVTDILLWIILTVLAMRFPRWWLTGAAALQMVACLGHFARLIYHPSRLGYAILTNVGAYPILIILAVAATSAFRDRHIRSHHPATGSPADTPGR